MPRHALVFVFATVALGSASGRADIIQVTTDTMTIDAGSCTDAANDIAIADLPGTDGLISLPEAICAANGTAGPDVIELQAGEVYSIAAPHNHWYGPTGLPAIASEIVIEGNGAVIERADGAPRLRLFYVAGELHPVFVPDDSASAPLPPTPGDLTLRDLTLRGGLARGGNAGGFAGAGAGLGGAIYNQGALLLEGVTATGNLAEGGSSGANLFRGGGGLGGDGGIFSGRGFKDPGSSGGFDGGGFLGGEGGKNAGGSGGASDLGGDGSDSGVGGSGGGGGFAEDATDAGSSVGVSPGEGGDGGGDGQSAGGGGGGAFGGGGAYGGSSAGGGGGGVGGGGGGGDTGGGGGFGGGGGYFGGLGGFGGGGGGGGGAGFGGGGFGGGGGGAGGGGGFAGDGGISGSGTGGGGGAGLGGVLFNHFGSATLRNSTLTGNTARGGGGGGDASSGHQGGGGGAGLGGAVFNLNGVVTLESSTLAGNTVEGGLGGGVSGEDGQGAGAAIFQHFASDGVGNTVPAVTTDAAGTTVVLEDSILADGTADPADPADPSTFDAANDCFKTSGTTVTLEGANLIESNATGANACGAPPLIADPGLAALADNGGPTPTMAIGSASPAFDAAGACPPPATDQRGVARPQGATCDLGAYEVPAGFDFGDAPDPLDATAGRYPTVLTSDGPRHALSAGLFLGACADAEDDGQPTAAADGDDLATGSALVGTCATAGADEDGVGFTSGLVQGAPATLDVTASAAGRLDAWIDWNADGDWDDAGEQVFADEGLAAGSNPLAVTVPAGATVGTTFARFRLSSAGGLPSTSFAADGEVEDYAVTIAPPIQVSIGDVSEPEGDASATAFAFTVAVSSTAIAVEVTVATADGTATTADGDYTATGPTVVTFPQGGPTTQTVTIQGTGDTTVEPDETFTVELSDPSAGAVIADGTGLGTIENDDAATLSIDDVTDLEGDSGTTAFAFTVAVSSTAIAVEVTVATADGTATTADGDYTATGPTVLTFPQGGPTTQTVTVEVAGDTTVEADEAFTVELSDPSAGAMIADGTGLGTIENDDAATLAIDDVTDLEGDSGTTPFTFSVTLDQAVAGGFTVDFTTADGSATTAGGDYATTSGTLTFAGTAGETRQVSVQVAGDTAVESDETFTVELSNLDAGGLDVTLADATGLGTLQDDDAFKADVVGSKEVTGGTLIPGGSVVYTVALTNLGPGLQQDHPEDELVDVLPPELLLVSATADAGTADADAGTNTVTWNGQIAAGETVTVIITATIPEDVPLGTTITNQGTIFFDADGILTSEASRSTDDPGASGPENPTAFAVGAASVLEIPTLDQAALLLFTLLLAVIGTLALRP